MTRRFLLSALLAAWAALTPAAKADDAVWMSPGPVIPAVTLVDDGGRDWRLTDLVRDRPVLIGFFFTGCATVCPLQTATMQAVRQELVLRASDKAPALLLSISLDPFGDTPQSVRDYAGQFGLELGIDSGWLMLTGPLGELEPVWASFDEGGAAQDHTAFLWIGQPGHRRWTRLGATAPPERIADLLMEPAP